MLGSMGLAVPIAFGVALAQPHRKVIALEGDGSILMQVGSLATVAARAQKNLAIVIMDNGTYQITGGQLTSTDLGADIVAMARGAGIAQSAWAADEGAFEELIELSLREDGPWLIGCRIDREKPADTTERDPPRIRDQFMRGLGVKT
jgi:thiamine pyrophosphate-dependent acetolactate synthase large subunit-like protein